MIVSGAGIGTVLLIILLVLCCCKYCACCGAKKETYAEKKEREKKKEKKDKDKKDEPTLTRQDTKSISDPSYAGKSITVAALMGQPPVQGRLKIERRVHDIEQPAQD